MITLSNSNISITKPRHVVFSNRAFTSVIAETKEKIATETGGIFLGVMRDETWYVIEAIDPGPKSIFQPSYFEYDGNYVRHLANKVNRLYGDKLDVLGLWHRHPGSMDTFSRTDDGTIRQFAEQNNGVTISGLVNIDPNFRLTMYSASLNPLAYTRISYEVGDCKIPQEMPGVLLYQDIESRINELSAERQKAYQENLNKQNKIKVINIIANYLQKTKSCALASNSAQLENSEDDYNMIIDDYLVDECLFCEEIGIPYACDVKEGNEVELVVGGEDANLKFSFYMFDFSRREEYLQKKGVFERIMQFFFQPVPAQPVETSGIPETPEANAAEVSESNEIETAEIAEPGAENENEQEREKKGEEEKHICFVHNNSLYLYEGNLLKKAWEDYKK
ncbi:MAG: Mov34/MPN/PAD-1 family protein [Oscillospiraceae bacterium]|nr:Mov34/MPN/PAD-1 family protein [Oscillospiraceae bacterium]